MELGSTPAKHTGGTQVAYLKTLRHKKAILVGMALAVVALIFVELNQGSMTVSVADMLAALVGKGSSTANMVIWNLRMPHILCALIGGIGLAIAGCVFQSTLHNPLASASTLGITQGAAFGASIALAVLATGEIAGAAPVSEGITWDSPWVTAACAFLGAAISMVAISLLARFRDLSPETIVLAGVALGALFTGATAIIQYFADDTKVAAIVFWTFGSLRRATYPTLGLMAGCTALCAVYFQLNAWNYNALASGQDSAHSLGVSVKSVRLFGLLAATLCASTIIAFCGTINFIGLIAPHLMRRIVGSDFRYLLPASGLCGAALLLASDIISTLPVPGSILPIGAVTAFVGVPFFIWILVKGVSR